MSNPFLFDDEGETSAGNEPAVNPFLLESTAPETEVFEENVDNPFGTPAINPFAFDAEEEIHQNVEQPPSIGAHGTNPTVDKAMSFFGTTITEDDDNETAIDNNNVATTVVNEPIKKAAPPPRPTPPNQQTQELISSVADHLDQTSSHLLDRIPKTRTPSPVSMRDLHSPSPTPENANLLLDDVLESNANLLASDNPFVDADDEIHSNVIQQKVPPRPIPPRPLAPVQQIQEIKSEPTQQQPEADLFDFEASTEPKPQVPKSNQDILNLFSAPKIEPQKPDLLTSDIFTMNAPIQTIVQAKVGNKPPVPPPPQRSLNQSNADKQIIPPSVETRKQSIPKAPSIENNTPTEIEQNQVKESVETAEIKINDEPYNVQDNGFNDAEKSDTISDNSSAVESLNRTPGGIATPATPFYSGPDSQYLDRGQSPVSKDEIVNSYINETSSYVSPTAASNPFGLPETNLVISKPTSQLAFPNDGFDAFAAKFDSSSGYKSPAPNDGLFNLFCFIISMNLFLFEL